MPVCIAVVASKHSAATQTRKLRSKPRARLTTLTGAEGAERFALFVGPTVLANNLMIIAPVDQTLAAPTHENGTIQPGPVLR
jgi:hypothetical protein